MVEETDLKAPFSPSVDDLVVKVHSMDEDDFVGSEWKVKKVHKLAVKETGTWKIDIAREGAEETWYAFFDAVIGCWRTTISGQVGRSSAPVAVANT